MYLVLATWVSWWSSWWSSSFHYWNGGCWLTQVKLNPNVIVCFKCTPQSFIDIIMITVWSNHLCCHKKVSSSLIIVLVNIESTKAGISKKGRGMTLSFFKCMICERCKEKWKLRSPEPNLIATRANKLLSEWTLLSMAYESFSDVGESRAWFASKSLTPCRMHWNAILIAQIIAKCHSFPSMYDML